MDTMTWMGAIEMHREEGDTMDAMAWIDTVWDMLDAMLRDANNRGDWVAYRALRDAREEVLNLMDARLLVQGASGTTVLG